MPFWEFLFAMPVFYHIVASGAIANRPPAAKMAAPHIPPRGAAEESAHRVLRHEAHAVDEDIAAAGHANRKARLRIRPVRLQRRRERAP